MNKGALQIDGDNILPIDDGRATAGLSKTTAYSPRYSKLSRQDQAASDVQGTKFAKSGASTWTRQAVTSATVNEEKIITAMTAPRHSYLGAQPSVRKIPKPLAEEGRLSLRKQSYLTRKMAIIPLMQANSAGAAAPVSNLQKQNSNNLSIIQGQLIASVLSEPLSARDNNKSGFDRLYRTQTDQLKVDRQRQNSVPEVTRAPIQGGSHHQANLTHFANSIERRLVDIYGPQAYETAVKLGARLPNFQHKQSQQLQLEGQRVSNLRNKKQAFLTEKLGGQHFSTQLTPEPTDFATEITRNNRIVTQEDYKTAEDNQLARHQQLDGTSIYSFQQHQKLWTHKSRQSGETSVQSMPPDTTRLARTQKFQKPLAATSSSSQLACELVMTKQRFKPMNAINGHQHSQMKKLMNLTGMSEILLQSQQQLGQMSLQHQQERIDDDYLEPYFPTPDGQYKLSTTQRFTSSKKQGTIFANLLPTYMKQQIGINSQRMEVNGSKQTSVKLDTTMMTSRQRLNSRALSSNNTGDPAEQLIDLATTLQDPHEPEEHLPYFSSEYDMMRIKGDLDRDEHGISPHFGGSQRSRLVVPQTEIPKSHCAQSSSGFNQQYEEEEEKQDDESMTTSLDQDPQEQKAKMKANFKDLAILASSVQAVNNNKSQHTQELQNPVLSDQPGAVRKNRGGPARFKSPYEQRLPLLAIKGEIKNQLFKKVQSPQSTTYQQIQPQHELPQVVTTIQKPPVLTPNSTQKPQQIKPKASPANIDANNEHTKERRTSKPDQQQQQQQETLQQIAQNKSVNHQQTATSQHQIQQERSIQMNKNAIQLQPVTAKSATKKSVNGPQGSSNSALDGAFNKHHSSSLGGHPNISFHSGKERYPHKKHGNALLYLNGNGNQSTTVRGASINQKTAASPTSPAALTQSACYTQQWSPLKPGSKPLPSESILTAQSKDQHLLGEDNKLSPMRTFMVERNAQKNHQLQNFSEFIVTAMTAPGPENQHWHNSSSTQPLDMLGQVTQAISTQVNTAGTQPRQGQNTKTISIMQKTSSPNSGSSHQQNMTLVQGKLLQNAKTRQFMRTNQIAAPNSQKLGSVMTGVLPSSNDQRNSGVGGVMGAMTSLPQSSIPSKMMRQDIFMRAPPQQNQFIVPSVLEKSFKTHPNQIPTSVPKSSQNTQQRITHGSRTAATSSTSKNNQKSDNAANFQQRHMAASSQLSPFIIDCNAPPTNVIIKSPGSSKPTSSGKLHQQKPLNEVRQSKNHTFKNQVGAGHQQPQLCIASTASDSTPCLEWQSITKMKVQTEKLTTNNGNVQVVAAGTEPLGQNIGQHGSVNEYFAKTTTGGQIQQIQISNLKRVNDFVGQNTTMATNNEMGITKITHLKQSQAPHSDIKTSAKAATILRMSADKSSNGNMVLPVFINSQVPQQTTASSASLLNKKQPIFMQPVEASGDKNMPCLQNLRQNAGGESGGIAVVGKATSFNSPRKSRKASQHMNSQPTNSNAEAKLAPAAATQPSQHAVLKNTALLKLEPEVQKKRQSQGVLQSVNDAVSLKQRLPASRTGKQMNSQMRQLKTTQLSSSTEALLSVNRIVHASTENLNGRTSSLQVGESRAENETKITGFVKSSDSTRQLSVACTRDRLDLVKVYKDDAQPNVKCTTRNNQVNNRTYNMNSNSSDDEANANHDVPLSQNHSEDNLNAHNSKINEVLKDADQQDDVEKQLTQTGHEEDGSSKRANEARRSSHKPLKTTTSKTQQNQAGYNNYNRGRRIKRKHAARSIISSKPSLNSNYSRVNNNQQAEAQQQYQPSTTQPNLQTQQPQGSVLMAKTAQAVVTTGTTGQAVPAVHDLSGRKFVKDQNRIDQYYQTAAKAQRKDGGEYSSKGQIPILTDVCGSKRMFDGLPHAARPSHALPKPRGGKNLIPIIEHSIGGGSGNQDLASMKSQGKIIKKKSSGAIVSLRSGAHSGKKKRLESVPAKGQSSRKLRASVDSAAGVQEECRSGTIQSSGTATDRVDAVNARSQWSHHDLPNSSAMYHIQQNHGSQRCNSAMRSPQQLQAEPSSTTTQHENVALRSSGGVRQPYKFSQQDSAVSSKSRPRTVTKAMSAASVGPNSSSFSRQNISAAPAESRRQPSVRPARLTSCVKGPTTVVTENDASGKETAVETAAEPGKLGTVSSAKKTTPQASNSIDSPTKSKKGKASMGAARSLKPNNEKEANNMVELKQPLTVTTITTGANKSGQVAQSCSSPTRIPKQLIIMSNTKQAATESPTKLQAQQLSAQQPQRLSTLAPKPGSSMQQQCQQNTTGTRSFFCDDEYVPSATNQPYSSCKSFVVIDTHHSKILQCKNKDEIREMASLTKMMTAIVTLELSNDLRLDIRSTFFKVSQRASSTPGTTANLVEGQVLSIWELLHGLMLPSGNDAAMALAENFSTKLLRLANRSITEDKDQPIQTPQNGVYPFVKLMNKTARKVHMRHTNYANPHGLADKSNHSTALEQAYLASYSMRNETFRQIVNSKTFTSINYVPLRRCQKMPHYDFTTWQSYDERDIPFSHGGVAYVQYYQTWYNSNKLLEVPGFCGVKTGQTSTAGACLAIYYKNTLIDKNLVTVVLGSKSVEYRWKDTRRLTLWADAVLMDEIVQRTGVSLSPTKTNRKATHSGIRQLL